MGKYIGFKMIEAEPMTAKEAREILGRPIDTTNGDTGYLVRYPDGYKSWSPASAFEPAYMQVSDNNTITVENVEKFIKEINVQTLGEKTTIVQATLVNGFVESSSCVDPVNYDEEIGTGICLERIKNQVWHHLGFLLQTAKDGIR